MPIYEYFCKSCNQVHEVIQKISEGPVQQCPSCSSPVEKKMSMSSFSLKGTGWYTTDYKKSSSSESSSSASSDSSSGKAEK